MSTIIENAVIHKAQARHLIGLSEEPDSCLFYCMSCSCENDPLAGLSL